MMLFVLFLWSFHLATCTLDLFPVLIKWQRSCLSLQEDRLYTSVTCYTRSIFGTYPSSLISSNSMSMS
uniref:Secreted protein n=1 Tax=Arundo donax TaxID=35708 RepID=A0A0A9GHN9_ARUDO